MTLDESETMYIHGYYNTCNCMFAQAVDYFYLKPNWLSLVNKYASIVLDKHNSNTLESTVTIAIGL